MSLYTTGYPNARTPFFGHYGHNWKGEYREFVEWEDLFPLPSGAKWYVVLRATANQPYIEGVRAGGFEIAAIPDGYTTLEVQPPNWYGWSWRVVGEGYDTAYECLQAARRRIRRIVDGGYLWLHEEKPVSSE